MPAPVVCDHRYPCCRKKSIWASQSSDERGHPWLKTIGWPTALRTGAGAYLVSVSLPERDEARAHVVNHFGTPPGRADPGAVDAMIDHCGRLPLALAYASVRAAGYAGVPLSDPVEGLRRTGVGVNHAFASS